MKRTYTPDELAAIVAAMHSAIGERHAEHHARGRQAVEDDPCSLNHSPGSAAWRLKERQERMAEDTAALEARVAAGNGRAYTFGLMDRIQEVAGEVAYWEGVRDAATVRESEAHAMMRA